MISFVPAKPAMIALRALSSSPSPSAHDFFGSRQNTNTRSGLTMHELNEKLLLGVNTSD